MLKSKYLRKILLVLITSTLLFSNVSVYAEEAEEVVEEAAENVEAEEVEEDSESEEDSDEDSDNEDSEESDDEEYDDEEEYTDEEDEDSEPEEPEEPEEISKEEEKHPYEEEGKSSNSVSALEWDITGKRNRVKTFSFPVPYHTVRMEFFYSAKAPAPTYMFESSYKSTYGSNVTPGSPYTDGDFKFLRRTGLKVEDYSDLRYDVIYISNPPDPGKWSLTITLDDDTQELFVLSSAVPENWETLNQDYKTTPVQMLVWGIDSDRSMYKASDIVKIVEREDPPAGNSIVSVDPEVKPPFFTPVRIAIIAFVSVIGIMGFLIYKVRKETKEKTEEVQRRRIDKANKKYSQMKEKEDSSLEEYMGSFDDEYEDDEEDVESYFSSDDPDIRREEERIKETRSNPNWMKEDIDEVVKKIEEEEAPQEKIPSWMPAKETAPPAWMSEPDDNDNDDDDGGFF